MKNCIAKFTTKKIWFLSARVDKNQKKNIPRAPLLKMHPYNDTIGTLIFRTIACHHGFPKFQKQNKNKNIENG